MEGPVNKLFFNCWELLFESTCLEECKDNAVRVELGSIYSSAAKKFKKLLLRSVIVLFGFIPYIFPIEFMAFMIKQKINNADNPANILLSIVIVVFGFLRYLSQLFVVSLMSSRKELLRVGLESFEDLKWVYKLVKFHYYRSLYLAILFEIVKNIAMICLLGDVSDFLSFNNSFNGQQYFNLMIIAMFILRYLIMLSIIDIGRISTRGVV